VADLAAVKKNARPAASLYERRKPGRTRSAIFFILLLVVFLLAIHFLNLFLQWTVIRLELAHGPVFRSPAYSFLGFSLFNQKEIAAIRYFENSSQLTRIFGFFDFFHPAIFAIWHKHEMAFIDLGPIVMAVPAGFSRISFFPGSVFFIDHENKSALKYFGASPGGVLWHWFLAKKFNASKAASRKPLTVSFVIKELEKSRYLKIPYLIYFYFPLLMIIFLALRYGSLLLMAFFYYAEIFFLFDYRKMFVTIPFDWIFKLFNWEITDGLIEMTAAIMVAFFVLCAVFGLWHWKKNNMSGREKRIILFFILLPFFLFF
jgi:hypothetical protein